MKMLDVGLFQNRYVLLKKSNKRLHEGVQILSGKLFDELEKEL